jgi:hypothetical protein
MVLGLDLSPAPYRPQWYLATSSRHIIPPDASVGTIHGVKILPTAYNTNKAIELQPHATHYKHPDTSLN